MYRALVLCGLALSACGGGSVDNQPVEGGQVLSFGYFQRCINPVFLKELPIVLNGETSVNTCAGSGCHDDANGTGGAFRVVPDAQAIDMADASNTPEVVRTSDMYRNFYSAQGEVVFGSATQSRLLQKPLLMNVLHGGGLVFDSMEDPNAKLIRYWITHPMPAGTDEFGDSSGMFEEDGACKTE